MTVATVYSNFYSYEEDKPKNPIKDILIFEKQIKKRYNLESRRRVMYFVILVNTIIAYVLYVSKQISNTVIDPQKKNSPEMLERIIRVYMSMFGTMLCVVYVFIRLVRRSIKVTGALSSQLRLLNISFANERINLCQIRTPDKIKKSLQLFREEEQRRRLLWLKKE